MFGIASHMPIRTEFWYSVDDPSWRYRVRSVFQDWRDRAVDAAQDFWGEHDGWEYRWPITFAFYETEEGPEVARFSVEMETQPVFTPTEAPPSADAVDPHGGITTAGPRA